MEVEHYHLALQVAQLGHLSTVVDEFDVQNARGVHLVQVYLQVLLALHDADVLHAFKGDVVQVLLAQCVRIEGVPRGGHGGKGLDVVFVLARVEDKHVAQSLEQGEIAARLHGRLEDVVLLDVFLVGFNHLADAVVGGLHAHLSVLLDGQHIIV